MPGSLIALICRHGETELNAGGMFRSWIDVALDANGVRQAHDAASFLSRFPVRRVVSSPLLRAYTTARTYAMPNGIDIVQDRGLLPWHVGFFAGTPKQQNMPALKLFIAEPDVAIPNGESLTEFEERSHDFFARELARAKAEGMTVFFAHTSNVTVLENLASGERGGEPEDGETVKPGGVCGIYADGDGYTVQPVFGKPEAANYGS